MPLPEPTDTDVRPLYPEDGAAELAALTSALRAELGRRTHMGRLRESGPVSAGGQGASGASGAPRATSPAGSPAAEVSVDSAAPAAPTSPAARNAPDLVALAQVVAACTACGLCRTRTQTVFGDGGPGARVLFVGEAPGADEDREGVPFVGRAGALLGDIIQKGMGLERARDVYIANVLKCRPPDNRDPLPEERELCAPYLWRQIELVDPAVIVPLGRHAAQVVLSTDAPIGQLRGRVHRLGPRAVVPTFHPAYLLRNPAAKRDTWADIRLAMAELGLTPPKPPGPAGATGAS